VLLELGAQLGVGFAGTDELAPIDEGLSLSKVHLSLSFSKKGGALLVRPRGQGSGIRLGVGRGGRGDGRRPDESLMARLSREDLELLLS